MMILMVDILVSGQFGESGIHFVGKALVSVFVDSQFVCILSDLKRTISKVKIIITNVNNTNIKHRREKQMEFVLIQRSFLRIFF